MPIRKFPIPPGVDRQRTKHSIGPRWYECNNMRFRDEEPETIGGWEDESDYGMNGIAREMHSWVDFSDNRYLCVGTSFKFYILLGDQRYDITPTRRTNSSLSGPFTTTAASSVISVADTGHGASVNDFVRFTVVSSDVDGISTAKFTDEFDGYQIIEVVDANNYKIDLASGEQGPSGITGATGLSGQGGSVTAVYRVKSGTVLNTVGSGWGVGYFGGDDVVPTSYTLGTNPLSTVSAGFTTLEVDVSGGAAPDNAFVIDDWIYFNGLTGTFDGVDSTYLNNKWWRVTSLNGANPRFFGVDAAIAGSVSGGGSSASYYHDDVSEGGVVGASRGWGDGATTAIASDSLRTITIQNFGEDLMFCNRGGPLYYWDSSANATSGVPNIDAVAIVIDDTITGALEPPVIVDSFVINEQHGHCMAFSCNDIGAQTQNNMLIRWSDRHNPFEWLPTNANEAGGRVLREGSEIFGAINTKDEIVVFTNTAVYSARYTGGIDTYGFNLITKNVSSIGRRSYASVDNLVFFMGRDQFYVYDGSVQPLSKNLVNYVFDDINEAQVDKIFTGVNSKFTEVYWFYPSSDSFEPNRYVSFNYSNRTWTYGSFDMTALDQAGSSTSLVRTSWHDGNLFSNPLAAYVTNYDPDSTPELQKSSIMGHEVGQSALNGANINHAIESGQIDISEGDMYVHYSRILPDVDFFDYEDNLAGASVTLSIDGRNLPGRTERNSASVNVELESTTTDEYADGLRYGPDYKGTSIRGRSRTISFRASSTAPGYGWRLGTLRLDLRPDGRRG